MPDTAGASPELRTCSVPCNMAGKMRSSTSTSSPKLAGRWNHVSVGGHGTCGVFGYGFNTLVPNLTSSILRMSYFVVSLKNWTVSFGGGVFLCCFHSSFPAPELFLCPRDTKGERPKGLNSEKCTKKPRHLCLISGEEARSSGGVGKEWMVLTRKIFEQ